MLLPLLVEDADAVIANSAGVVAVAALALRVADDLLSYVRFLHAMKSVRAAKARSGSYARLPSSSPN